MDYEKAFREAYSRIRVSYPITPKAGSAAVAKERLKDVILSDRMSDRSRWRAIGKRALERIRESRP